LFAHIHENFAGRLLVLRAAFIALSENRSLRHLAESSSIGHRVSGRFVAGTTVEDALRATEETNSLGMSVSIDNLGENVTNADEAQHSAALYHELLDRISERRLDANVSLKLTHMGFDVDQRLANDVVSGLVEHARQNHNFVRVDMEGSPYTQRTLDLVQSIHSQNGNQGNVGAVIQAYLRRSEDDIRNLTAQRIRIRLCKGAYKENAEIAFPDKRDVDANYIKLMKILLKSGIYHGIATHDEKMIESTIQFAQAEKIPASAFEFQMLYGIRRDLQRRLVKQGWRMRVYIPFGTEWYPYFMRRLAERPANALFVARNLLRK
jgi:proline dehydrogenase